MFLIVVNEIRAKCERAALRRVDAMTDAEWARAIGRRMRRADQ